MDVLLLIFIAVNILVQSIKSITGRVAEGIKYEQRKCIWNQWEN